MVKPSKQVEKVSDAVVVSENEERAKAILMQAVSEMARPEQSALEMALAIMEADSDDAVFGSTVLHLRDIVGEHFTINRASLTDSEYEDGLPAYAIIEATMDDGSSAVITSGAVNIVASLINWHARKSFPIRVSTREQETSKGYFVLRFIKPTTDAPTQAQLQNF